MVSHYYRPQSILPLQRLSLLLTTLCFPVLGVSRIGSFVEFSQQDLIPLVVPKLGSYALGYKVVAQASGVSSLWSTGGMNSEAVSGGSRDNGNGNDVGTGGCKCNDDGGGGNGGEGI
ncbi:hypothetical protein Tco_0523040 [Tanacetum coccineum]